MRLNFTRFKETETIPLWQEVRRIEDLLTAIVEGWKEEMSPEAFQERFKAFMRDQRWKHNAVALAQSLAVQTLDTQQPKVTCD
jgi:hypothetical protein